MKTVKIIIRVVAAAFAVAITCSCGSRAQYLRINGYAQGGTYSITCKMDPSLAPNAKRDVDSILAVIDNSVSGYNPVSLLSRANRGEVIEDDGSAEYRILSELTAIGDSLYVATEGALDTRSGALFDIWGFGFKNQEMPSDEQVAAAMKNRSVLNFNSIAQGYSCDVVAAFLRDHYDVRDILINVGGEIFCSGLNPSGLGWKIAVDTPEDGNMNPGEKISDTFTVPAGRSCGVVTSGNYRKFYIRDGVKYSHSVDPRTGRPVQHSLLCATIIADNATLADALATYCMVIGPTAARSFILSRPDLDAILITPTSTWQSFK